MQMSLNIYNLYPPKMLAHRKKSKKYIQYAIENKKQLI